MVKRKSKLSDIEIEIADALYEEWQTIYMNQEKGIFDNTIPYCDSELERLELNEFKTNSGLPLEHALEFLIEHYNDLYFENDKEIVPELLVVYLSKLERFGNYHLIVYKGHVEPLSDIQRDYNYAMGNKDYLNYAIIFGDIKDNIFKDTPYKFISSLKIMDYKDMILNIIDSIIYYSKKTDEDVIREQAKELFGNGFELIVNGLHDYLSEDIRVLSTAAIISPFLKRFKIRGLGYKLNSQDVASFDYPLNLYFGLSGKSGVGKTTILKEVTKNQKELIYALEIENSKRIKNKMGNKNFKRSLYENNFYYGSSSSMGIWKNFQKGRPFHIISDEDADRIMGVEETMISSTPIEALLKLYTNSNEQIKLTFTNETIDVPPDIYLLYLFDMHPVENYFSENNINNGFARRLITYCFNDEQIADIDTYITNKNVQILVEGKKSFSKHIDDWILQTVSEILWDKSFDATEEKHIIFTNESATELLKVVDEFNKDMKKFPEGIIGEIAIHYVEHLQRLIGIYTVLQNGDLKVEVKTVRYIDSHLRPVMLNFYKELGKILGKPAQGRVFDYTTEITRLKNIIETADPILKDGKFVATSRRVINQQLHIKKDDLHEVLKVALDSKLLSVATGNKPKSKTALFVGNSYDFEKLEDVMKKNGYININIYETSEDLEGLGD